MQRFGEYISESSLSRIYQHFNSDREVGTMTAFRGEYTYKKNVERNRQLERKVRAAGFGFIWVDGAWVERKGTPEEKLETEVSLFIVGDEKTDELRQYMIQWAREFDQDGVLYKPADQTEKILVLDKTGNVDVELSNVKYDEAAEMYTRLRRGNHVGRSFHLENVRERSTFGSKLLEVYGNRPRSVSES